MIIEALTETRGTVVFGKLIIAMVVIAVFFMEDVSMTKAELIDAVASNVGISKKAAAEAVDSVFGNITKSLKRGGKYTHVGFGTFSVVKRAAREGRNPQSGATIRIPARNVVKFTAGKALKEAV